MHTKIIITITEFEDIKGQITEEIKNTGYKRHIIYKENTIVITHIKRYTLLIYMCLYVQLGT